MERRLIQLKQIDGNFVGDKHYKHEQREEATVWAVHHNLNKYPSVSSYYFDNMMNGVVRHVTNNFLEIEFCVPRKGIAICNYRRFLCFQYMMVLVFIEN